MCALSLFVSVLLHEFAHSLVAIRRGYKVEGITLFLLGGVSSIASESRRALDDFVISVVGPLSSLAIAAALGLVAVLSGGSSPAYAALEYVAIINLLLGLFNLLPAFPLDGGRVLQSGHMGRDGELSPRVGDCYTKRTGGGPSVGGIRCIPSDPGTCAAGDMGGARGMVLEQGGERKPESGRG